MSFQGIHALNSLIQHNQQYGASLKASSSSPTASNPPVNPGPVTPAGTVGAQSADSITLGAVPAPSDLYKNISTLATLEAVEQINGLGLTRNGQPTLPLGDASQAAAVGRAYQAYNQAMLVSNVAASLNPSAGSVATAPLNLPPGYFA